MIKLIVTDVDGTLVEDGTQKINTEIYRVIDDLTKLGITVVGASGRQYTSMKKLFGPVADKMMFITEGGGIIFKQGEIVSYEAIEKNMVVELVNDINSIQSKECDAMVCGLKRVYVEREESKLYQWMKNDYQYDIEAVGDLTNPIDDEIVKVSIYHPTNAEGLTREWFVPKWSQKLQISCAGIQWMDCVLPTATKGEALNKIQKMLGVTKDETMAFGDNLNDITMLSEAKYSYAVGNARPEVKKAAAYQADTYQNDGVLKELKKFLEAVM